MLWFHHILLILLECVELFVLLLLHTAPLNSDSYGLGCFFKRWEFSLSSRLISCRLEVGRQAACLTVIHSSSRLLSLYERFKDFCQEGGEDLETVAVGEPIHSTLLRTLAYIVF